MSNLEQAEAALSIAAALLAVGVAVRRPKHWPIVALLVLFLLQRKGLVTLYEHVIQPAQQAVVNAGQNPLVVPLTGWARVGGHAHQALFMLWMPAVATMAALVFERRHDAWLAVVLWAGAVATLVLCYDCLRGTKAGSVYLIVNIVSLGLAVRSAVGWAKRRVSGESQHLVALLFILFEGAGLLAHKAGLFGSAWDVARLASVSLFGWLILIQGGCLCWDYNSSSAR